MKLLAAAIASLSLIGSSTAQADPTKAETGFKQVLTRDDVRMAPRRWTNTRKSAFSARCGSVRASCPATAAS